MHTFSYENNKMNTFVEKVGSIEINEKNRTNMLDIKSISMMLDYGLLSPVSSVFYLFTYV